MESVVLFILGVCIGSFLNVLIDRLPAGEDIFTDRSHCDWCKKTLRWYELVPVLSYVFQAGKCRRCRHTLSIRYPLVELLTGVVFAYFWILILPDIRSYIYAVMMASVFIVLFFADLHYQILPDSMILVGITSTLLYGLGFPDWQKMIFPNAGSGLIAALLFFILWYLTRGKGLGFGDVKLVFLLGLFLGYPGTIIALYIAFLTGAGVGVILMLAREKTLKSKIAFGPFLIAGAVGSWLFSTQLFELWHRFTGL